MLNAQISVGIRIGAPPPPRVNRYSPAALGPSTSGWRATGIQQVTTTSGTTDTGSALLTLVRIGYGRITTETASMKGIEKAIAGGVVMIITWDREVAAITIMMTAGSLEA